MKCASLISGQQFVESILKMFQTFQPIVLVHLREKTNIEGQGCPRIDLNPLGDVNLQYGLPNIYETTLIHSFSVKPGCINYARSRLAQLLVPPFYSAREK